MAKESLKEVCRKQIVNIKMQDISSLWNNNSLILRSEKVVFVFEFTYNLKSNSKNLEFSVSCLPCSTDSPATDLLNQRLSYGPVKSFDLSQMIIDSSFWPHNMNVTKEMITIISCKPSPEEFPGTKYKFIAVLNIVGHVEIFIRENSSWKSIFKFDDIINQYFNDKIPPVKELLNFNDLKNAVDAIETCEICWKPELQEQSYIFATAQKNGVILFWQLSFHDQWDFNKIGHIETSINDIVSMIWISRDHYFTLVLANAVGEVYMLKNKLELQNVTLLQKVTIWEYKDRIPTYNILCNVENGYFVVIFAKNRHLIIVTLDNELKAIHQITDNLNDYGISCIMYNSNGCYYITTKNYKVFKLHVKILAGNIQPEFEEVLFEDPVANAKSDLLSCSVSQNSVIFAAAVYDKFKSSKELHSPLEIVFYEKANQENKVIDLIINSHNNFSKVYDCIELTRCNIVRQRKLPSIDFEALLIESEVDIDKLKLYYLFLRQKHLLQCNEIENNDVFAASIESIKDKMCALHAVTTIKHLIEKSEINKHFTDSILGARQLLKLFCKKYKISINTLLSEKVLDGLKSFIYENKTCQICPKPIKTFTCEDGHLNQWCSKTFTLIETDNYFVCVSCGAIAREDLCLEQTLCLFCNIYMSKTS